MEAKKEMILYLTPTGNDGLDWLQEQILKLDYCNCCGDKITKEKAPVIWWIGRSSIFLCSGCLEHVIEGLSRDLMEYKGDTIAKGKPSNIYNPVKLKQEASHLRDKLHNYSSKIIELQDILAKRG